MPSGTLGQSVPALSTNTTVYTVPASKVATFNINICNRGSAAAPIRLAIAATGTPADMEYLEFDTLVNANGVLERSGLVATAAKNIVVYCGSANFSINIYGFEE